MKQLAYTTLLIWALMSLFACNPARQVKKYDYLTKDGKGKTAPASANREVQKVVNTAKSYIGTPYKYGGMSKRGMDCSGLVYTSYKSINKELPRTTTLLSQSGQKVNRTQLKTGDLVFFNSKGRGNKINHVGLVVSVRGKKVEFVHSTTSRGVRVDQLNEGYWSDRFRKAVRVDS